MGTSSAHVFGGWGGQRLLILAISATSQTQKRQICESGE